MPFVTVIMAFFMLGEPIKIRQAIGMAISFGGVAMVVTDVNLLSALHSGLNLGDLLIFGSTVVWALYSIWGRQAMKRMSPLRATTFSVVFGLPITWLLALLPIGNTAIHLSAPAVLSVLYVGSFVAVGAFLLWYILVKHIGVIRAAP